MGRTARKSAVLWGLAVVLLAASGLAAAATGSVDSFMDPQGPVAAEQKRHLIRATLLILVAVIPVLVLVPLIVLRYRRRHGGTAVYRPQWEFAPALEATMWGVPVLIVGILSYHLWQSTHRLDPYTAKVGEGPPVRVQVVGLDWKWLFLYPDLGIATVGEVGMPVGRPLSMVLTTDTVMQSFMIPALAGQIYAMPGMTTELKLAADQTGRMEGENTQYNGRGFTQQKFTAISMEADAFEAWVEQVKAAGIPLDDATYKTLALRSDRSEVQAALGTDQMPDNALYFTLPEGDLFHTILARYHGGAALSPADQPGTVPFTQDNTAEAGQ